MIEAGRLLRSNNLGCVFGCKVSHSNIPEFGSMIRIPIEEEPFYQVFALVYDINIADDGLVRQLILSENVSEEVILDNRVNRNVPLEISSIFIGYQVEEEIFHLIPPKPPLTLDMIFHCNQQEMLQFCEAGKFGYIRHILRGRVDYPVGELLAVHLKYLFTADSSSEKKALVQTATREVITLLRDDYPELMNVLGALSDSKILYSEEG